MCVCARAHVRVLDAQAFLGTLTSKLRNTDGWCVRAILNDGSSTMEVEFGNEVSTSALLLC